MICLTGDIHHSSLRTNDQNYLDYPRETEAKVSCEFTQILSRYGLKVTFYTTGRTLADEWEDFKPIAESRCVEIGGHTYDGLPQSRIKVWACGLAGRKASSHAPTHGSRRKQKHDIERMVRIAQERTGRRITSWRSHGFLSDRHTYGLLAEAGIQAISDEMSLTKTQPAKTPEGLVSHPINVIHDHDHLYHAHRDEDFVRKAKATGYGSDVFGNESYAIEDWGEIVEEQVARIQEKGHVATILMHPICQYLADEFKTAERLFRFLSRYENCCASDLIAMVE